MRGGIDPIASDLRTVEDLKEYPHIFIDPENPKKGRIINSPTIITAQYDLTLLEEPAFDQEIWDETKATTFPPTDIVVAVHKDLENQAVEVF